MEYVGFNKKNEKSLIINCETAEETKENKILMRKIVATFLPKSRLENEVKISGDLGIVESNLENFIINGNSKIKSKDFLIESSFFRLKNKYILNTDKDLVYRTENLKGDAKKMDMNLETNILNFYNTFGIYKIKGKLFNYRTDFLQVVDKKQLVIFEKRRKTNMIKGKDFLLKGFWIQTKFDEDYKKQINTFAHKKCYFLMTKKSEEEGVRDESRGIRANILELYYTDSGDISSVKAMERTRLNIVGKTYSLNVVTNILNMDFYEKKQSIKRVKMESPLTRLFYIDESEENPNKFNLRGKEVIILYNEDGEIVEFETLGNEKTKFKSDTYFATGERFRYKLLEKTIIIKNNAVLEIEGKKRFNSSELKIDTENNILSSLKPLSAKIVLEKKSVIFSTKPIFINANSMRMDKDKNIMKFTGNVILIQDEISIKTDILILSEKDGVICKNASGKKTSISFVENGKEITISGNKIDLKKEEKIIKILGKALMKDGDNEIRGNELIIHFGEDEKIDKITGSQNINFKKDSLMIESNSVKWLYTKDLVIFDKLKHIKKKETGSMKGKTVRLNLKTNIMTVMSDTDERTETVLD